jgi:hypothetical protein
MLRLAQKVVSQVFFFFSWKQKKVYDGGGRETSIFFLSIFIF